MGNIYFKKRGLEIELCPPDFQSGYYRGTRFDHSGVFRRIVVDNFIIADEWFDTYNPYAHDAVCGASEEFTQLGYEEAQVGEVFMKPGVGLLLKEDESEYDRFKLYNVEDCGSWTITNNENSATFIHILNSKKWSYIYEKVIKILDGSTFEISHRLCNTGQCDIKGSTYNHNFFTFGDAHPGPDIEIDFPFSPNGDWRSKYESVALTEKGIRFSRDLVKGESVFMGNLKPKNREKVSGNVYQMRANGHTINVDSDRPFDFIVFWANHRIACVEPYIPYAIASGEEFDWKYTYKLYKEE